MLRSLVVLVAACGSASGFRAGPTVLVPQRSAPVLARAAPPQLSAAPGAARLPERPPRFAALPALVAGTVAALPALALASAGAGGEHLHLGQKVALFFKGAAARVPGTPPPHYSGGGFTRALWARGAAGTGLPDWAILVLVSMLPAIELRGGVPVRRPPHHTRLAARCLSTPSHPGQWQVGNWLGLSPLATFVICVAGNMLPIAPTLLALRSDAVKKARRLGFRLALRLALLALLCLAASLRRRWPCYAQLAAPLLKRAEKKMAGLPSGQSRTLGLALFVGIPAPGTGAPRCSQPRGTARQGRRGRGRL